MAPVEEVEQWRQGRQSFDGEGGDAGRTPRGGGRSEEATTTKEEGGGGGRAAEEAERRRAANVDGVQVQWRNNDADVYGEEEERGRLTSGSHYFSPEYATLTKVANS